MTDTSSPTPHTGSQRWTLHTGDARAVLVTMPAGSADCIVTSPPYWGKRDYGAAGQYGWDSPTVRPILADIAIPPFAGSSSTRHGSLHIPRLATRL